MDIYRKISELIASGEKFAVATVVRTKGSTPQDIGAKMIVREDGSKFGTIGGDCVENAVIVEAQQVLKEEKSRVVEYDLTEEELGGIGMSCGGNMEILIEVVQEKPKLLIIGSGHIAVPLAKLGHLGGFSVIVIDPFARKEDFPDADIIIPEHISEAISKVNIDLRTYVVIVTRHKYDEPALRETLHKNTAYLGLVGSRRRIATIFKQLIEQGKADKAILKKIHAPIGLDIGAQTVEEIAFSIIAEIIKERRGGTGESLVLRNR